MTLKMLRKALPRAKTVKNGMPANLETLRSIQDIKTRKLFSSKIVKISAIFWIRNFCQFCNGIRLKIDFITIHNL